MRGSLEEFTLPDVLQVVGSSRQHTVIELRGEDGASRGFISMKAGQVLNCESNLGKGRDAFFDLFQKAPGLFCVFRLPDRRDYGKPLGALTKLLFEAADRSTPAERPPTPKAGATSRPAIGRDGTRRAHTVRKRKAKQTSPAPVPAPSVGRRKVVVAVASPKGGVGKTTIALNLALSLAERGVRTTLVDADINGDLLSLVDARGKATRGAFDLLDDPRSVSTALCSTACEHLEILPAAGPELPVAALARPDLPAVWDRLIRHLEARSDLILVDCPAGMFHTTSAVLRAASHVVGVFQAEMVTSRSFDMFLRGLDAVPVERRPALAGVVVNMFHGRADFSLEAFQEICDRSEQHRLFDTTIPRSDAFGQASLRGQPLRSAGREPSTVAWLFDMLADEVCHRVGVSNEPPRPSGGKPFVV